MTHFAMVGEKTCVSNKGTGGQKTGRMNRVIGSSPTTKYIKVDSVNTCKCLKYIKN